jgi:hypothetical protein
MYCAVKKVLAILSKVIGETEGRNRVSALYLWNVSLVVKIEGGTEKDLQKIRDGLNWDADEISL